MAVPGMVDLDEERKVHHTGHGHCIYEGWTLKGWPVTTIARGRVVYESGNVDESGFGRGQCVVQPN
jgi:dihydropyrimidinase